MLKGLEHLDSVHSSDAGAWLQLRHPVTDDELQIEDVPVRLKLAGPDAEVYALYVQEIGNEVKRATSLSPNRKLNGKDIRNIQALSFAPCVLAWEGLSEPFERRNVEAMLRDYPWIFEQATKFAADRANFLRPTDSDGSKSSPVASGKKVA